MDVQSCIDLYAQLVTVCLPVGITFGICNLMVKSLLRVAFGGRLTFDA